MRGATTREALAQVVNASLSRQGNELLLLGGVAACYWHGMLFAQRQSGALQKPSARHDQDAFQRLQTCSSLSFEPTLWLSAVGRPVLGAATVPRSELMVCLLRTRRTDSATAISFTEALSPYRSAGRTQLMLGQEFQLRREDVVQMGISYRTEGIARPYRGRPRS